MSSAEITDRIEQLRSSQAPASAVSRESSSPDLAAEEPITTRVKRHLKAVPERATEEPNPVVVTTGQAETRLDSVTTFQHRIGSSQAEQELCR